MQQPRLLPRILGCGVGSWLLIRVKPGWNLYQRRFQFAPSAIASRTGSPKYLPRLIATAKVVLP